MSRPAQAHSMAPDDSTPRDSAIARSSATSTSRSKQSPQQQLSTIEKSVTHLLVATKQLLETLTMWSTSVATEGEVSDVYVRLGYEFNIACRAFNAIGVDTSDLGPVPDLLRDILEETLSQEASKSSLENYLPRIRDIVINLLHGLKKKQQRLRQKSSGGSSSSVGREGEPSNRPPRQASMASTASVDSSLTHALDDVSARQSSSSRTYTQTHDRDDDAQAHDLPRRTTSVLPNGRASPKRHGLSPQTSFSTPPPIIQEPPPDDSASSMSGTTLHTTSSNAPYPEDETMPSNPAFDPDRTPEPTKPASKSNDALTALQRGGELERRASRRFSAYHLQKHLGSSVPGIPALPPAQSSPIPNRGRDMRESMNAVRSRGSILQSRARSRNQRNGAESSPSRDHDVNRISEEQTPPPVLDTSDLPPPAAPGQAHSPVKTHEDKLANHPTTPSADEPFSATLKGPLTEPFMPNSSHSRLERQPSVQTPRAEIARAVRDATPQATQQYVPEASPQAGKELTLFLQYKSKIKKFVLSDGGDLSIPRLQLAFIEKFAWNTHNNGVDLPEIYIQDPISGIRHELEDLRDIKERSVLVLNVEALDEVKRHFDDGIGGLRRLVEGIRHSVDDHQTALQRVSARQQETAKELASIAVAPAPVPTLPLPGVSPTAGRDAHSHLREVQSLRRDLAVVRQTYNSFVVDVTASMSAMRTKATDIKTIAASPAVGEMDNTSGRYYVNTGKKTLSDDSESIVNRVDDLQDVVEDLRKDVVTRGVRPLPRQLEIVSRDISIATADLKKLQEFLKREKPVWTKIWEKELQVVCDDRDLLTMQEELAADLEDDLDKAAQTFALVEQATRQQSLNSNSAPTTNGTAPINASPSSLRSTSRTLMAMDQGADPHKAKDTMLGEVRALQPNHESRLEAIERAEKARQRELELRAAGEFQRELGSFVADGKLKKSGGVQEVERLRTLREEQTRREIYERMQARLAAKAEKEAAAARAKAQAAKDAGELGHKAKANDPAPAHVPDAPALVTANADPAATTSLSVPPSEIPDRESSPEPTFFDAANETVVSPPA